MMRLPIGGMVTYLLDKLKWYCSNVRKLPDKLKEFNVRLKCIKKGLHDHGL